MSQAVFIEPVDVLYLRGNRLFGATGEHGEALMPPWPSVPSGAIRSHVMTSRGVNFEDFVRGDPERLPDDMQKALGTPQQPGSFTLRWFSPALRKGNAVQPVFPLPQDIFIPENRENDQKPQEVHHLQPCKLPAGVQTSAPLEQLPALKRNEPAKPASGWWLNAEGLQAWVEGKPLTPDRLIAMREIWRTEQRLGIARDNRTATAAEGQIYTSETVAFRHRPSMQGGFLALVDGINQDALPDGLLRFGGDGRAAHLQRADWQPPEPDWECIKKGKACRILLATPGIFPEGWRLPGMDEEGRWQLPDGFLKGRVVAAAVARGRTVSGWDLAQWRPKSAQRSVPVGSVYWLTELEGDICGGLQCLLREGLWAAMTEEQKQEIGPQRRAEGFNACLIGTALPSRNN